MRLTSDIEATQVKKILEILRDETELLSSFTAADLESVSQVLKILSFKDNEDLCREGEPIDYFGIICHGTANVIFKHNAVKKLSVGDTIGQCFTAEFTTTQNKHLYTITTKTSGLIAVLPLGEVKSEIRKNPEAISKLMQVAANAAFETVFYNIHGAEHNPKVTLPNNGQMNKGLRDFFFKNAAMRAFLKGVDKRDERIII